MESPLQERVWIVCQADKTRTLYFIFKGAKGDCVTKPDYYFSVFIYIIILLILLNAQNCQAPTMNILLHYVCIQIVTLNNHSYF